MKLLAFCLLLGMSAQAEMVKFPCPENGTVGIYLGDHLVVTSGSISGYDCPFKVGRKGEMHTAADITIDGIHYDLCLTRNVTTECHKSNQRAADETDGKPPKYQKPVDLYPIMCGGAPPHPCNEPPGGPVDVPAVQVETGERHSYCEYLTEHGVAVPFNQGTPSTCEKGGMLIMWRDKITTCADKSRILEHDENSPAKYWCRKVQP